MSPIGLPCQAPSWGDVAGIDPTPPQGVWQHKKGANRGKTPAAIRLTGGVPGQGGALLAVGG
ncbi:hypothetical protein [Pseudomonas aeruginosa]|uniref:hypothetical protein n=1 Tax=Pseudomonas aeruginosa TaxID=287 RepID=UPI00404407DF